MPDTKIKIGVSSCLIGEPVRWNGDHKQNAYVRETLARYFEWVPVCPEMEVGMGVPREPVHLEGDPEKPAMIGNSSGKDWTRAINRYAVQRVRELNREALGGFIFKNKSPSCGLFRVPIKQNGGHSLRGSGLFAASFAKRNPLLPMEEEGRLSDAKIRENFIERVFAYRRLLELWSGHFSIRRIIAFHTKEKFLLLSHSRKHYDHLGQMVAQYKNYSAADFRKKYSEEYMQALSVRTTPRKHTDVMQHMMGFLKKLLTPAEKKDLLEAIQDFKQELTPLVVPLTLLKHFVNKHQVDYLQNQVYLNPHPRELMLRNHV